MKTEVTMPEKNIIAKKNKKGISIIVSFFISSKIYIIDLFNNLYKKRIN